MFYKLQNVVIFLKIVTEKSSLHSIFITMASYICDNRKDITQLGQPNFVNGHDMNRDFWDRTLNTVIESNKYVHYIH